MIASPSDTREARDAVESAIHQWNNLYASGKNVVLLPWRWETSATPALGKGPQSIINKQGVDDCDIVVAIFGTRLGSPTPDAVSGTVEEIERALAQGKPVHIYFSNAPLPVDVDTKQLEGLRKFRRELEKRGLLGSFDSPVDLEREVWKAIEYDIAELTTEPADVVHPAEGVKFLLQPQQERELRGTTTKGRPQYRTRTWIDVTNTGDVDAQDVTFEVSEDSGLLLASEGEPTTIHAGQTRRLSTIHTFGGNEQPIVHITWSEDGQTHERSFHVG